MSDYTGMFERSVEEERQDALDRIRDEIEWQEMKYGEERRSDEEEHRAPIKVFKPSKYDPNEYKNILERIK